MKLYDSLIELSKRQVSKKGYKILINRVLQLNNLFDLILEDSVITNTKKSTSISKKAFFKKTNDFLLRIVREKTLMNIQNIQESFAGYLFDGLVLKYFTEKHKSVALKEERIPSKEYERHISKVVSQISKSQCHRILSNYFENENSTKNPLNVQASEEKELMLINNKTFENILRETFTPTNLDEGINILKLLHQEIITKIENDSKSC